MRNAERLLVLIALALVLGRSFIFDSLWLDETVSAWIISGSFTDTFERAWNFQGQSPLYFLCLWSWAHLFGESEFALRLPSFFALSATCVVLLRWCARSYSHTAGVVAVIALLSIDQILTTMSVRPYAFGMLCVVLALRAGTSLSAIFFLTLASYCHYLFLLAGVVNIFIAGKEWRQALKGAVCAAILSLPALYQVIMLARTRSTLSFLSPPHWLEVAQALFPPALCISALMSFAIVALIFFKRTNEPLMHSLSLFTSLRAYVVWWWVPVITLWLVSHVSEVSFLSRYVVWAYAGAAMVLAVLVAGLRSLRAQRVFLLSIATFFMIITLDRDWKIEDWRSAFSALQETQRCASPEDSVWLYSGLIELEDPSFQQRKGMWPYLNAPAEVYGAEFNVKPLSAGDLARIDQLLEQEPRPCAVVIQNRGVPPSLANTFPGYTTQRLFEEAARTAAWDMKPINFDLGAGHAPLVLIYAARRVDVGSVDIPGGGTADAGS